MTSKRRKSVSEYFETNKEHLPVNNIGESIQSHVFYGSKHTSSALNENESREEIRRSVTSQERPSVRILMHFPCIGEMHLDNIIFGNLFKNTEIKFAFFQSLHEV